MHIVFLSISLFIAQNTDAQNEIVAQQIRIDPSITVGGAVSQYIDKVNFIVLESIKKSRIGVIFQLEITEKYFILLDSEPMQ